VAGHETTNWIVNVQFTAATQMELKPVLEKFLANAANDDWPLMLF